MKTIYYKGIELFMLFIVFPISLILNYSGQIKMLIGIVGFVYIVFVLLKTERKKIKIATHLNWKLFFKQTLVKLLTIAILTTFFVCVTNKEALFSVMFNKPKLWLFILFFYSFFSVYPQELIYRTFFFQRYEMLFKSEELLVFINAILFALAHLFFKKTLVIIITFFGGLLFALTYKKTKSTLLVSIEHAVYGCWLFTIGMGDMLGFPV